MTFVGDYIYVIRDGNYNSENVYRVCHGSDLSCYFGSSCVCFMMNVSASVQVERDVLCTLRRYCKNRDDIGSDYFDCELYMLIDMILHIVMKSNLVSPSYSFVDDGMLVDTGC